MHGGHTWVLSGAMAGLTAVFTITLGAAVPAQSQTLEGKTVTFYIGGGAGGGIDAAARTFLPYLNKHLAGKPTIVASNMGGAGGMQAAQFVFNATAKDGTAFSLVNAGPIMNPLLQQKNLKYEIPKFHWIGSLHEGDAVCYVWHESRIKSLEEARRNDTPVSSSGTNSSAARSAMLVNAIAGTKFKPIHGFRGAQAMLAIERRETEGYCNQYSSVQASHGHWLKEKKLNILVQLALEVDPALKSVPRLIDLAKTEEHKNMVRFYMAPWQVNHALLLPPGTPPQMVAIYRKAFDAAVKEAGYIADATKRGQEPKPKSGAKVGEIIAKLYATPKDLVDKVVKATTAPGGGGKGKK